MTLTKEQVLISNGYLEANGAVPSPVEPSVAEILAEYSQNQGLLTIVSNFTYYGYLPSWETISALNSLSSTQLGSFWKKTEAVLKEITADNRRMDDFVVYQNFPKEVLEMSQSEYWVKQILMYFGFDKEFFRQTPIERDPLLEKGKLRVLHLADDRALHQIYGALLQNPSRWTKEQLAHTQFLLNTLEIASFGMDEVRFRENGIQVINSLLSSDKKLSVRVKDATDVLRLAALRSESDVSLRTAVNFKSFPKSLRRLMCSMLEESKNLDADVAERPQLWKRLLGKLHPGDFRFERVSRVYDELYNSRLRSFASQVENGIREKDSNVLKLLSGRPGEYLRRFHHLYSVFGDQALEVFSPVMEKLTTIQLLKFLRYVETTNGRCQFAHAPRGNWSKLKVKLNDKAKLDEHLISGIRQRVGEIISVRLREKFPEGCQVDPQIDLIKLQTNDQELAPYGRGTVFPIPEKMNFLRTASYWETAHRNVVWFDNGWNFFDSAWQSQGAVCWNANRIGDAAIFSGDPVNTHDNKGRACQMIDLYIDRLLARGVRYAVWNILCFSRKSFSEATGEVLATLQWGEDAQKGKLYEPGRAQMVFPLTGNNLTKYIAYIDLEKRQLVYIDANLKGNVSSAASNSKTLSAQMPAFLEYLNTLPSAGDLFYHADEPQPKDGEDSIPGTPILYTDENVELVGKKPAYVFQPRNQSNTFEQVSLAPLLS